MMTGYDRLYKFLEKNFDILEKLDMFLSQEPRTLQEKTQMPISGY